MRANYRMMRDLDTVTKLSPSARRNEIIHFIKEVQKNEVTVEILSGWGLSLNSEIVQFMGRQLGPEMILFGQDKKYQSTQRPVDWSSAAVKNPVLRTVSILNIK